MDIAIAKDLQFPMATFTLDPGESARIQRGSMIYRSAGVDLNTKTNSKGGGLGGLVKAAARSVVSGESVFITEVVSQVPGGQVAIAPASPGTIVQLDVGAVHYRLNDSVFLAMESSVNYVMERQKLGKAVFAGQGGLFVMSTEGTGRLLVNAFGSIKEINLENSPGFTVDNGHVVAWDKNLNYKIELQSGLFGSIGTGEGVVNTFTGTGKILIQTLNLASFAGELNRYIASGS
jgi:uncharacterized protein (TIGR00266 family)